MSYQEDCDCHGCEDQRANPLKTYAVGLDTRFSFEARNEHDARGQMIAELVKGFGRKDAELLEYQVELDNE